MRFVNPLVLGLSLMAIAASASGTTFDSAEDVWVYPFGATGTRTDVPLFEAIGEPTFDDADAQFLFAFDTDSAGGLFASGQGASNYDITSATITFTVSNTSDGWLYDGSFDAFDAQDGVAPIELYGAGYRNGFNTTSYVQGSGFSVGGPFAPRNVFATDDGVRDVSNYVTDAFNPDTWAIGQIAGATDGDAVTGGTEMTFTLDVNDPTIRAYLQGRLDVGEVDFVALSLYASGGQGGTSPIPRFDTRETPILFGSGQGPVLDITLAAVPEPSTIALLGVACAGLARFGRRRHA